MENKTMNTDKGTEDLDPEGAEVNFPEGGKGNTDGPYGRRVCSEGLTTEVLREHLYAIQAGHPGRPEIAKHLAEDDCQACTELVQALRITEPFLRGNPSTGYKVHTTVVDASTFGPALAVDTERERALDELTEALLRVILDPNDLTSDVDRLEGQFFGKSPGVFREDVSLRARARHKRIPKALQEKVQGYWAKVVDDLAEYRPEVVLDGLSAQEAAAFRVWALGESWMLAAKAMPWSLGSNSEGKIRLTIERGAVIDAVETARELRSGAL